MKESSFAPESSLPSAETISLTLNHISVNFLLNHTECGLFVVIYAWVATILELCEFLFFRIKPESHKKIDVELF